MPCRLSAELQLRAVLSALRSSLRCIDNPVCEPRTVVAFRRWLSRRSAEPRLQCRERLDRCCSSPVPTLPPPSPDSLALPLPMAVIQVWRRYATLAAVLCSAACVSTAHAVRMQCVTAPSLRTTVSGCRRSLVKSGCVTGARQPGLLRPENPRGRAKLSSQPGALSRLATADLQRRPLTCCAC